VHVPQQGLTRSHFSFLFLQETHEIVFSRGFKLTAKSPAAVYVVRCVPPAELLDDAPAVRFSGLDVDGILLTAKLELQIVITTAKKT